VLTQDLYTKAESDKATDVIKEQCREAFVTLEAMMRELHWYFTKPGFGDERLIALGLKPHDTTKTPQPVPSTRPVTVVQTTKNHFEHRIYAKGEGATKPDDAYGVRYAWQLGGEAPASAEGLTTTEFRRAASFVVTYSTADRAKIAYYATCYENGKGEKGPWSEVVSEVVA
jgi:hypothetical protein